MQCLLPSNGLSFDGLPAPEEAADGSADGSAAPSQPREALRTRLWRQSEEQWQNFRGRLVQCRESFLRRLVYCRESFLQRLQQSPWLQRCPSRTEIMGFVHRRSTDALILSVFVLVRFFPVNLMTTLQQLLCLVLLALPKQISRSHATRIFIAAACLSLFSQFLGFTGWNRFSEVQMQYFGVAPRLSYVCRDLIVIILAMLEGMIEAPETSAPEQPMEQEMQEMQEMVVFRGASTRGSQLPDAWRRTLRPQLDPAMEVRRLLLAVPQLAALCIVVINILEETFWCLPSLAVVGGFYASGGMVKPSVSSSPWQLPERARFWIQVMVISLAVGMLGEMSFALWLPPVGGMSSKPVPDVIAHWEMCRNYDPWNPSTPRNVKGQAQPQGLPEAGWFTQRQRCGGDVVYWLCLESGLQVPKFILFFSLCWVLHTTWDRPVEFIDQNQTQRAPRWPWLQRGYDYIARCILQAMGSRSETEAEKESDWKLLLICVSTVFCWLSVILAFIWQRDFNIVALGYLWMALMTSSSASNATSYNNPERAILWPARAVGIFNFLVIVASVVCQCPSFPCPYSLELTGPAPGEMHATRFLSGEQCLRYSQKTFGSEAIATDTWMMGTFFQSFGMMKTGGSSKGGFEDLVHCLVFASCLIQRILVERWREDLREHFVRRKALLEFRAQWYAEKLATSRQVQLSMWDTKRQVLLHKLTRVTQQLNTLRSIWDGQRPAFTEKEEEENHHKARVEHICLKGGVNELLVTGLVKEFTKNCGEQAIQELNSQKRLQAHTIIDKAVVEYLHRRYLRKLKMITSVDEAASKQRLMQESQLEVEILLKDQETEAEPEGSGDNEHEDRELRQRKVSSEKGSEVQKVASLEAESCDSNHDTDKDADRNSGAMQFWANLCEPFLDDMLFIREKDETLYEHRKGNSPKLLICKSLLSQSVPALVVVSALQFMAFRSICSGVTVSVVICALMAFPHVPWNVWVTLQWFNISVIFAKVVFQLPVFCEDGTLNITPCRSLCSEAMPWTALLGLVKTQQNAAGDPCSLAQPSLTSVLWADVLFSAVLLVVMFASRLGGRFGSTSQILRSLKIVEKKNRRMSTHINREILKQASLMENLDLDEEEEEDEELGGNPSGTAAPATEESTRSRRAIEHVRQESKRLLAMGKQWWKENVVVPAYVRKPARDFYEIRLSLALTCLAMLIFGWTSMVDSGRSFSTSLKTNNFSGTQVRILVLFLIMIVIDRALYTWYRGDHGRGDGPVGVNGMLSSASLKGLMARVVQKIMLLVHVICIHTVLIEQWSRKVVRKEKMTSDRSLISLSMLSGFYVLYLTYLALSSLQLKYDVHVMRGGLRFCHSTDIGSMLVFKAYSAIPFLNELRVITDWTVTETSMNLFMWLKLEDAHHSLYRTRLDMEGRAMTEPASARPMFEKVYMGVALLLLLLGLLVGPIIFFSALNTFMLVPSVVKSATMAVDVKVEASYGHRTLNLYTAVQDYIENRNESSVQNFQKGLLDAEIPISLQDIRFPYASDELWETSASRQQMIAELLHPALHPDVTVKIRLSYQFYHNSSLPVEGFKEVVVGNKTRASLGSMLMSCLPPVNVSTCPAYMDFVVPHLFPKSLRVSFGQITPIDFVADQEEYMDEAVRVAFHRGKDKLALPHWRVMSNATAVAAKDSAWQISRTDVILDRPLGEPHQLTFTMASNYISATRAHAPRADQNQKQMSINGLYLGVVLTIGNLFRSIFKDSSKRMIYEEVNDTDLLLDLCDGIYLARVQGNLRAEWMLYHELIRIYRSPELLAHLSGKKGPSPAPEPEKSSSSASRLRWGIVKEHIRSTENLKEQTSATER